MNRINRPQTLLFAILALFAVRIVSEGEKQFIAAPNPPKHDSAGVQNGNGAKFRHLQGLRESRFGGIFGDILSEIVLIITVSANPNGRVCRHPTASLIVFIIPVTRKISNRLLEALDEIHHRFAPPMASEKARRLRPGGGWQTRHERLLRLLCVQKNDVFVHIVQRYFLRGEKFVFVVSPPLWYASPT